MLLLLRYVRRVEAQLSKRLPQPRLIHNVDSRLWSMIIQ